MSKIKIDENLCIGCYTCASLCEQTFEIGKKGKAKIKNEKAECDLDNVEQACPVQAIKHEKS